MVSVPPPVPRISLVCEHCGVTYERMECELRVRPSRFCSRRCKYESRRRLVELVCVRCGTRFERKRTEVRYANRWCSRRCYDADRRENRTSYPKVGARHEHRVVAERMLGRPLRPGEVVHHRDGDKQNNAEENIEVLSGQSEHVKLHRPSRWRHRERAADPAGTESQSAAIARD